MNLNDYTRDDLIKEITELRDLVANVVWPWGDKRELLATLQNVGKNEDQEYTEEEALNAQLISDTPEAFEEFVEMIRASFERGGISYAISENISAIMQEVAERMSGRK